eukprot:14041581-Alexandrium_andersonii.AAC.1
MSASLVGSEMCIRDRLSRRLLALSALRRLRGAPRPRGSRTTGSSGRRWPVSYTHLTLPTICSV